MQYITSKPVSLPILCSAGVGWRSWYSPSIEFQYRLEIFLFSTPSRPALASTQPPTICQPTFFSELKRLGREVNHSSYSGSEVKNDWSCTSTPPYVFMSCRGKTLLYFVSQVISWHLELITFRMWISELAWYYRNKDMTLMWFWPCIVDNMWK
jgi:hypothetical protein